ncbi:hypothetical protein AVEN_102402-1 [Araneus ventricosus]|uniref:Integrase p58-like C-terminal domain-containing protein n=1 Tax=Araneus ventricosus TaxID=182803 RepID=A0A4Y2TAH3_ARAVE|nr:hypothetical protein AVEN_102402-1 [Araneus ventricosus]
MAVQWTGPGVIESQLSDTNYIVKMANENDKTQIYHVNLLKPYHQRPEKINLLISERKETPETESDELGIPYPTSDPIVYDQWRTESENSGCQQSMGAHSYQKRFFSV